MVGQKPPPPPPSPPPSGRTNLASCIVATICLIFVIIIALIIFFTLLKPQNPTIAVTAVQIPSFSATNATVAFTVSQYVAVRNPNGGVFTHYDSSIRLLLQGGGQAGLVFVPAGKIAGRRTEYMAATFEVEGFPVSDNDGVEVGPSLEIETRMEMAGRVGLLGLFTHHVEGKADCKVEVAINGGSVLGFHC